MIEIKKMRELLELLSTHTEFASPLADELLELLDSYDRQAIAIDAMMASARLVWADGGYSGASGNWPLVEAYGMLEQLEESAPVIFARICERAPAKEYTDEPCSLCSGTGKRSGATVAEIQNVAFDQGKDVQRMIDMRMRDALTRITANEFDMDAVQEIARKTLSELEERHGQNE